VTRLVAAALVLFALIVPARAHDEALTTAAPDVRDGWIELGRRIHGGFGSLIALGIRLGFDASLRTGGRVREFDVTYFEGPGSPCPCVADGIMAALAASPGQRTLRVSSEPAPAGALARILIRHKPSGALLEYTIPMAAMSGLGAINRAPPEERWDYVMRQPFETLFEVAVLEGTTVPLTPHMTPSEGAPR
jgi:hypothetical protein